MDVMAYHMQTGAFGCNDPKEMPATFFYGAIFIDYKTAMRANWKKQALTVAPRFWYIDADFLCSECRCEFTWTARQQKLWFEEYRLRVSALPHCCKTCVGEQERAIELRHEYDTTVARARNAGTVEQKKRIVEVLWALAELQVPLAPRMRETLHTFERQISRMDKPPAGGA